MSECINELGVMQEQFDRELVQTPSKLKTIRGGSPGKAIGAGWD